MLVGTEEQSLEERLETIQNKELREKGNNLYELIDANWARSTARKYSYGWNAWVKWSDQYDEVLAIPADPFHICLYLNDLSKEKKQPGTITNALTGIRWGHLRKGYQSPTDDCLVQLTFKGALRIASEHKVSNQKEPLPPELVKKVCEEYGHSDNLMHKRFLLTVLIGYFGFLRIDEILWLQVKHFVFSTDHIDIMLEKSKTDQNRHGNKVTISDIDSNCSVKEVLDDYLTKAKLKDDSEAYILCKMVKTKEGHKAIGHHKISYTTARKEFLSLLSSVMPITEDVRQFCTHSMRSGGATAAINNGVSEREIDLHGRWKSEKSRNKYLKDSLKRRLKITRSLGI